MANNDGLSQNIELNVSVNQQSIKKAQDAVDSIGNNSDVRVNLVADTADFMAELRKELGFGATAKIRVGGYSTGNSPDRTVRNKAASKIEQMGGDWNGIDIADKAEVAIAKNINEAAKELATRIGIKFVDQYAATIGEADFALPDMAVGKENIQKLIEDFIVDAAGGVTISPAMLLAAAERVYQNNKNISVPGGPKPLMTGSIKPSAALPEGAKFDAEVTKNFDKFLESAIGENPQAAAAVNDMLYKKLKVVLSKVVDAGQKAREDTFKNAGVAEGQDAAEGLVRYADNAARAAIALQEMLNGLQAGTTAAYARGVVPEKFRPRPEAVSDPANLANVLVGDYQDSVTGALMSSLPDPKKVADPIAQILLNPYILGDRFVAGYEKQVQTAIKNYGKNTRAEVPAVKAATEAPKRNEPAQVAASIAPGLDKYRPLIGDAIVNQVVKIIAEAGGDVSKITAAFDTEFIQGNTTPIYEAGVTIKNALGEFVDLIKMIHLPQGTAEDVNRALKQAGAGAKTIEDIKKRGAALGIPQNQMSYSGGQAKPGDIMDTEVYAAKIDNINILLKMLDELGVQIAGSNIVGADFRMLAVSVENVNKVLSGLNTWPELKAPILDNVVDFKKVVEQLQAMEKSGTLSSELAPIIQGQLKDGVVKGANGLGDLLGKAIDMQPELAKQYGVQKQGNGFSIDGMPAHVAVADNRAALIVLDFLKQFAQSAQLISQGTSLLGPAYGNGVAGPYSNKTRETNPSAFGGGTASPAERAAAADVLVQETNAQEENNRAVKTGTDLAQKRLGDDKEYKKLLDQLTDARKAYQIVDNAIGSDGVIKPEDKVVLEGYLVKLDELAKTSQEAATAAASLRAAIASPSKGAAFRARRDVKAVGEDTSLQMSQKAYEAEAAVKEVADKRKAQSGKNYANTATQVQREVTGATLEYIQKTESEHASASRKNQTIVQTRIVGIEQENKARKDASETIKRIYKDQVEAEKAVQAATKASINTWVTGRYALYDVGNAYQNVSTQLFRVARRIFDITKSYRDYETAFTSVERAMQLDFSSPASGAQELKDQFIKLSEVIPVAFEELSRVATLGAQMGIGAKGIVKFTETVSQFAAVTGISADTVAQKFGKIAELTNLDTSDFDRLGSAVAFAGINAVATESEILTLSEGIAAVSSQVGMTTPDVIGLGTALSSVGVPAEQARGVFTRVFADIDRAVSSGGEAIKSLGNTSNMTKKEINKAFKDKNALTGFAAAANMSVEEFSNAWGKQGKSYDVFRAILGGINSAADLTKAFDKLGITETREVNTLTRLAKNLNVVDQAASDSAASFGDGQFLLESFSKTTDNLDSKITIFQNNLKSLGEQLGQNFSGTLKEVVDIGSEISKIFKEISKSPVMQMLTNVSLGTTVLVGGLTGFMSVMAKVVAQIYAFRVAMVNSANDPAAVSGITKQIKQLTNFRSGLIEMRNELQTPNAGVRGNIQPVDYGVFGSIDKQIQKKLESDNLYIASGDKVLQSIDARKRAELQVVGVSSIREAKDAQRVLLARTEADQINKLVIERRNEIKNLEQLVDTSTAAGRAKIAEATASKILYRWVNGEAIAYTEAEVARARGIISGEILANKKQKEAAAHLLNADAINAETAAASRASTGIMGVGSKVMGFLGGVGIAATVLTTIIGIIDGIRVAVGEANKIDLAGSGFTVEALKDTITQDTQAWMDNGEAIGLVTASYTSTQVGVNKYADAVSIASSKSKQLYTDQKSLVDVTKQQTVALGDATRSLLSNAILANEKIKQIIDSNGEIFQQLAKSGVDVAEFVDSILQGGTKPQEFFKKIADEIAAIDQEIANVNSNLNAGDGSGVIDTNTSDYLTNLQQRKAALVALGDAGREAIAQIEKALVMSKVIDMLKGYSAGFVGLEAKIKAAAKSGKGMAGVLALVKTAAADLIKNTDIVVNFDGDKSVAEMLKTAKAAKETALALLRLKLAASNASPTAAGQAEQSIIAQYAPLLKNLELLSNSVDSVTDAAAKGAESAADKLKRLISEANSLASASMQLNSALRSVGDAFKASKDWSISSEGGAAKFDAILAVITQIGENAGSNFPKAIRELQAFQITLKTLNAPAAAINLVSNAIKKLGGDSTLTAKQIAALKKAFPTLFANMLEQVKNGTTEIKTLIDYANDLKSVMSDALSRRYGKQTSLDEISNAWQAIKDSAKSAQQAMDDANKTIVGLNADKNLLDYQLKIAIKYKDIERQKYLTNKLAEVNANLAEESQKVSEANALKDKSLKGDSKNVIDNRNQVRGLVQTYTNYLATLAASGMSSTDLKAKAGVLAEEFLTQGQNLGFAKSELKEYTDAFLGDFTKVIDGVPNEVTLKVNTDPALAAIEEFVKKANKSLSNVNIVGGVDAKNPTTTDKPSAEEILAYKAEKVNSTLFALTSWDRAAAADKVKAFEAKYGKGYATGGFISGPGTGTSDSIPALLSNGEYVIKASSVKSLGTDFLDQVNENGSRFADGGFMNTAGYNSGHAKPKAKVKPKAAEKNPWIENALDLTPGARFLANTVALLSGRQPSKEDYQNGALGLLGGTSVLKGGFALAKLIPTVLKKFAPTATSTELQIAQKVAKAVIGAKGQQLALPAAKPMLALPAPFGSNLTRSGNIMDMFGMSGKLSVASSKLSAEEIAIIQKYITHPLTLHGSSFEYAQSVVDKLISKHNLVIPKGTDLARVANAHDAEALASLKVGDKVTLDRFMSVTSASSKDFIEGMSKGALDTGGRSSNVLRADGTYGPGTYPIIKFDLKSDIPGVMDLNSILPSKASNVVDGLLARGQSMKLQSVKTSANGQKVYTIELGSASKGSTIPAFGLNEVKYLQEQRNLAKRTLVEESDPAVIKRLLNSFSDKATLESIQRNRSFSSMPIYRAMGGLIDPKRFADGGYAKGKDTIPAMLSPGEFVMSAGSVSRYGVDFLNALNQQRASFAPVQPQAQAQQQSTSQMVYLSPEDRQLLRAAIDRPVALYTENTKIAASANAGNLLLAQRGSN